MNNKPAVETCCPADDQRIEVVGQDPHQLDEELAEFAKAIGHPVRVRILRMLARQEAQMCSHIVDHLPLAQSTVSEHLRILRTAGLVKANESTPRVAYCIVPSALKRFKALLEEV